MIPWIYTILLGCGSEPPPEEEVVEEPRITCLDACWLHFKDPRTSPKEVRVK